MRKIENIVWGVLVTAVTILIAIIWSLPNANAEGFKVIDNFHKDKDVKVKEVALPEIGTPLHITAKQYPLHVSFYKKGKSFGSGAELQLSGTKVKALDNLFKSLKELKPVYLAGGYYNSENKYNLYGGMSFKFEATKDIDVGAKIVFLFADGEFEPKGHLSPYIQYKLGNILTNDSYSTLYFSINSGEVGLDSLSKEYITSLSSDILKNRRYRIGVYIEPNTFELRNYALSLELNGKNDILLGLHYAY